MILKIVYDIDVKDENDDYIQMLEDAVTGAVEGLVPGKFLVEFLPFLRYIPPWLPGATSQRLWAKWMAAADRLKNTPFQHTKMKLVRCSNLHVRCRVWGCMPIVCSFVFVGTRRRLSVNNLETAQ